MKEGEKRRLNVFEMKCLRKMCGVTVMDRISNDVIRIEVGVMRDLAGRVEICVLRWFGHIEHMDSERMAKRIYDSGLQGRRGRPNRVWMDGAKAALSERGLTLEHKKRTVHDRLLWKKVDKWGVKRWFNE